MWGGFTYKEQHVSPVVAAFDGRVFEPSSLAEVHVVISPGGVLDWLVVGHCV